jgi:hypothetical protein
MLGSTEAIELRAHQNYLERGRKDGYDLADWLAAEERLVARRESEASASRAGDFLRGRPTKPTACESGITNESSMGCRRVQ